MHGYDYDDEAEYHNRSLNIIEMKNARQQPIDSLPDYNTGNRGHHLPTIQITSRHEWNKLNLTIDGQPNFIENLLGQNDSGHDNQFGELRISLIRRENQQTGNHDAIFIIYSIPHYHGIDGHVVCINYADGSDIDLIISDFFDNRECCIVLEMSENQILNYFAKDTDALHILQEYFIDGFNSIRFDEEVPKMKLIVHYDLDEIKNDVELTDVYFVDIDNNQYNPYCIENHEGTQPIIEI